MLMAGCCHNEEGRRIMLHVSAGQGLARRVRTRPARFAHLESLGGKIRGAGGMWSEGGQEARCSVMIIEAASLDEAK
jgi:uncharacterized protein YciI